MLPWFGGAATVWTTSLVFYQVLLLGGYLYAHLSRRLPLRTQAAIHVAILLATLLALPILPSEAWKPTGAEEPTMHLLMLLGASVGAPYLLLSSTSPLLHDWFGRLSPRRSPYQLFAVSNAGSLLALLAYPFVVEPLVGVDGQAAAWAWGYGVFVAGMAWIAWTATVSVEAPQPDARGAPDATGTARDLTPGRFALWFLLAACGSGILLAVTNQMTLDVASVPFLWVMPLALYLATFILAFAGRYDRTVLGAALGLALGVQALLSHGDVEVALELQVAGGAAVLLAACWVCHGELARSAPGREHLTAFYLTMSAGGAVGGAAVSLAAPALLPDFWELPAFLLLAWVLLGAVMWSDPSSAMKQGGRPMAWRGLLLVGVVAATVFVIQEVTRGAGTLASERNFYGVVRVFEGESRDAGLVRGLRHGRILHGSQLQDPARRGSPTAYYASESGVHRAMRDHPRRATGLPLRVGVIGQGVGTVAAWGRPGDSIRFYEINPAVDRFARAYFTFMEESRAAVDVVLGDGRLSLEREVDVEGPARRYDVLVVDAFSGDAIPTHLLTREAAELYWRVLEPDGVLAFHVTNRHMDLTPVVRELAAHAGHQVVRVERDSDPVWDIAVSEWLLVLRDPAPFLGPGATLERDEPRRLWTDRFSNLLHVLR